MENPYWLRGIRGATTVEHNKPEDIYKATKELLIAMLEANNIKDFELITSIFFTTTPDLNSTFPPKAARTELGMDKVPLMSSQEIAVEGDLERVIRIMMHVHTQKSQQEIQHIYLHETKNLRPDLIKA